MSVCTVDLGFSREHTFQELMVHRDVLELCNFFLYAPGFRLLFDTKRMSHFQQYKEAV